MRQINPSFVVYFAAVLVVVWHNANAQMMRQPAPMGSAVNLFPRESVTEDQWINSIVDHWTASQRKSWRALDRRFAGWVAHLVWLRKTQIRPSSDISAQAPHLPPACPVDSFVVSPPSVDESMNHFREIMPGLDWNAWANIEPAFRAIAEWEMSTENYRAQVSKTLKEWWTLNNEAVRACLNATASGEGERPKTANPRYAQIDRRVHSERSAIDHMVAPEPVKVEAREQISDAAAVEKYAADVDEHRL